MKVVSLTCSPGQIYIVPSEIVAIAAYRGPVIKTQIWVSNQEEPFNILEDVETVRKRLGWRASK